MAAYSEQKHLHADAPYRAAMLTYPGNLREALLKAQEDARQTLFGTGHGIPSTFLIKVVAATKPDFIWIDVEHGMFNRLELHDAIQAAQFHSEGKSMVVVRVPKGDEISLTTALDAGAAGIVIPHCETAQEVKDMVKEAFYPPIGHRSFSPWTFTPGVADRSLYPDDMFNVTTSNRHVCIIPQIESLKGIENIEEIAALEYTHALLFGPGDFMLDAGIPLRLADPDVRLLEAMGKFSAAGKKYNKPLMAGAQAMEQVPMMLEQGFRGIVIFMDVWGISQTVYGNLAKGRDMASKLVTNGEAVNGKVAEEEKITNGAPGSPKVIRA